MNLWLLVPVKPLGEGKSRLAHQLNAVQRAELSRRLLAGVLGAAQEAGVLTGMLVISRDPAVLSQAAAAGAVPLHEATTGLNEALSQGRAVALSRGAEAVLVLPADLPLIIPQDIRTLYAEGEAGPGIVIAPSHDGGTNALLLRPPTAIEFAFGPHSFTRHCALAAAAGLPQRVVDSPTLAFDIDWPQDLALMPSRAPG